MENTKGKQIEVTVIEVEETNEYSLILRFDGHCSMSTSGYKEGGDFTMYSMTPEALAELGMEIITTAARAKATRELNDVVKPAPEDYLRAEQEAKC